MIVCMLSLFQARVLNILYHIRYTGSTSRRCGGMVDTLDSKSSGGNSVSVRVRPAVPNQLCFVILGLLMQITRKRLGKATILALIVAFLVRVLSAVSILGIYSCQTDQCLQHDAGRVKMAIIDSLNYVSWVAFLLIFAAYIYFVVTKKP